MRYFCVDYENVKEEGMNGIEKLLATDCVKIYYSKDAEKLTFGLHRRITESKAHIEYIKVINCIKNALDCKIVFDLQDNVKSEKNSEYFIISKDKDYDKFIEELKEKGIKVERVSQICDYQEKEKQEKKKHEQVIRSFFGKNLRKYEEKKEEIIQVVLKSETKQQLNNQLQQYCSNSEVKEILNIMKPLIKELSGR